MSLTSKEHQKLQSFFLLVFVLLLSRDFTTHGIVGVFITICSDFVLEMGSTKTLVFLVLHLLRVAGGEAVLI